MPNSLQLGLRSHRGDTCVLNGSSLASRRVLFLVGSISLGDRPNDLDETVGKGGKVEVDQAWLVVAADKRRHVEVLLADELLESSILLIQVELTDFLLKASFVVAEEGTNCLELEVDIAFNLKEPHLERVRPVFPRTTFPHDHDLSIILKLHTNLGDSHLHAHGLLLLSKATQLLIKSDHMLEFSLQLLGLLLLSWLN